jgi:hypothetical protein
MVQGVIWKKSVAPGDLDLMQRMYAVINDRMVAGQPMVYVYATSQPAPGFVRVEAGLEEVYFTEITDAENRYHAQRTVPIPTH